jgi:hypothetical protein
MIKPKSEQYIHWSQQIRITETNISSTRRLDILYSKINYPKDKYKQSKTLTYQIIDVIIP